MAAVKLTNPQEIAAFFLSQVIRIAINAALARFALTALYGALLHGGRTYLIGVLSIGIGALLWLLALPLFLLLRMALGGVPAVVAGPTRQSAFTTSGGEIGAYALSYVIELVLSWMVNFVGLGRLYTALHSAGHTAMILPVSLVISAVFAAVFFLIFIGLRRAFGGPADGAARQRTVQR